jgi:hypothetical protein
MDPVEINDEMRRAQAEFQELISRASVHDLRRRSDGTRWTNRQLLFHMVLGYLVVRTLLPPGPVQSQLCAGLTCGYGGQWPESGPWPTAAPSTCTVTKRVLPRSERLGGRSVDATAQMRPRIAASPGQHPNRSTACLTTLHEPWGCPVTHPVRR